MTRDAVFTTQLIKLDDNGAEIVEVTTAGDPRVSVRAQRCAR